MKASGQTIKLLVLSKYSRKGASSRYRQFQYYPSLEAKGVEIETAPLFDDDYLDRLYSKRSRLGSVIKSYFRRAGFLLSRPACDVVWVEKELFPWVPWFIEKWFFKILSKPVMADYDDAIFHQYDKHRFSLVRALLGKKCDLVMSHSNAVIVGNSYLAARAEQAGARKVVKIPTVVSEKVFYPRLAANPIPMVGWIGSMSTAVYLSELRPALVELKKKYNFVFRVVGARLDWTDVPVENIEWTESEEVASVQSFDIGVMPLVDSYWERGKCGFKLVQYMACGKPVVADPVGVNVEIVEDGVNGLLTSSSRTWYEALQSLLEDVSLRQEMGQKGRERFQTHYSLEIWQGTIFELISELAFTKGAK
jgi:glycosyltransferase involved in cell wall biosynthesis